MSFKVVVFDMDGTLLNRDRQVLPATIDVLDKLQKKGIKIVLATGRHHIGVYPYIVQLKLNTPAICCNGSYVYDFAKKEISHQNVLTKDQSYQILKLVREYGIHTLIYTEKEMTYEVLDAHLEGFVTWSKTVPEAVRPVLTHVKSFEDVIANAKDIFKFATSCADLDALHTFNAQVKSQLDLDGEWSWHDRVDVAQHGNTKGACLKRWLESDGLSLKDAVAFGDNENDLSMLTTVGLGIAMGNAKDEVKNKVSCVIGDNNHNSIAEKLTEIFDL